MKCDFRDAPSGPTPDVIVSQVVNALRSHAANGHHASGACRWTFGLNDASHLSYAETAAGSWKWHFAWPYCRQKTSASAICSQVWFMVSGYNAWAHPQCSRPRPANGVQWKCSRHLSTDLGEACGTTPPEHHTRACGFAKTWLLCSSFIFESASTFFRPVLH